MNEQNFIENQLVILTKQTLDIFLRQENPADLIALYTFYYYTAKWQSTNQIKCTTQYVANGLHWSEGRVRKVKKQLIEFGLIEDAQSVDKNNRITGHYIKMNYIFKKETIENIHPYENPQGGNSHRVEIATGWSNPQGGNSHSVENLGTNALSDDNINALSDDNINALSDDNINALSDDNINALSDDNINAYESVTSKDVTPLTPKTKKSTSKESITEELNTENTKGNPRKKISPTYYPDELLNQALLDFIEMRKKIKKPMTNRAIELLQKKLKELSTSPFSESMDNDLAIKILEQSIMNCWQSVYPLKDNNKTQNVFDEWRNA